MSHDQTAHGLVVVPAGEGVSVGNVEFLACSDDTPRFNLALIVVEPHTHGPAPHRHTAEDDAFYVLEGELTMYVDRDAPLAFSPGTFILVRPGLLHTFANTGDAPVRMLNIHAPAGFDRFLLEQL